MNVYGLRLKMYKLIHSHCREMAVRHKYKYFLCQQCMDLNVDTDGAGICF